MTEQEWLECTDCWPMLKFLRGKASERKLRLLACACCRNIWTSLRDERSRQAVEIGERFADGETGSEELAGAYRSASAAVGARSLGTSAAADAAAEDIWGVLLIVCHDASGEMANQLVGDGDDPSVDGHAWDETADRE